MNPRLNRREMARLLPGCRGYWLLSERAGTTCH